MYGQQNIKIYKITRYVLCRSPVVQSEMQSLRAVGGSLSGWRLVLYRQNDQSVKQRPLPYNSEVRLFYVCLRMIFEQLNVK